MDKLVFLFRNKPGSSLDDYFEHYITAHSPLGLQHQRGLAAYTVNLLDDPGDFAVVTEIWTPAIGDFLDPDKVRTEGEEAIIQDHMSFMGPQDTFAVEERVRKDGALTSPLGQPSPGVKVVSLHRRGEPLPEPAPGATRVVDNVVTRTILLADQFVEDQDASDIAVIRTTWADSAAALGMLPGAVSSLKEYRWRTAEPA